VCQTDARKDHLILRGIVVIETETGPPTGICAFVVGNLDLTAMRRFDLRDGNLGLTWLEKCGVAANR
jgi:hypothetical protein